ncbi:hypothetical protein AGDE_15746 [Angomonas deanei]|nr:hypothetical protein AGDE_15746 [Angomonas deanei]|eukprot:EPY18539.1 hypothetical protein AGDE_15746 [Angomonas deanei]
MTEKVVTPTPITEGTSTFLQAPHHKGTRKLSDNASSIHSEENQSNSGNERQECSSDDGYKSSNEHTPFRSKRNSILSLGDKHSSDAHSFGEENTMTKEFSDSLTQPTCTTVSDAQDTTKERSRPVPIVTKMDANTNHTCTLSPTHLSHNYCVEHSSIPILVDTSNGSVSESGSLDTNHRTPFVSSPGLDVSSSSSIGGHHLSINLGDRFLKQADSRREEQFYATIAPYQGVLVESAVRQADHTIAVWSGEEVPPRESTESNTREDHLMRLFRFSEQQSTQEYRSYVSLYCSCDTTEEEAPLPSEEDRSYYNSVSHSELEKVRLAASLWWNRQWEGPVPMLGKCFHDDLSAPCSVHGDLIEQLNPSPRTPAVATPHKSSRSITVVVASTWTSAARPERRRRPPFPYCVPSSPASSVYVS